jgi:hypothetical protein
MKTGNTIHEMSNVINANPLEVANRQMFKFFSLPICLAIAMSICLGSVIQTARAENSGTEGGHRGYKYIKPEGVGTTTGTATQVTKDSSTEKTAGAENSTSGDQNSQINRKIEPVNKPTDGKGLYPTFSQADINGDHYITKYELKNYPYLLQVFDKVDAGKDGKLEQHEYQNLEMETKREGEVR